MKRYSVSYYSNSIIYRPQFAAGVGVLCYFGILFAAACGILIVAGIEKWSDKMYVAILILSMVLLLSVIMSALAIRVMFTEIHFTYDGIYIINRKIQKEKYFSWGEVKAIRFYYDQWYGRKLLRFYREIPSDLKKCDPICSVPINGIDEKELRKFVPNHLLGNWTEYNDGLFP